MPQRGGAALFRLDRIHEAEGARPPHRDPAGGPRDLADGLFARATDTSRVTILLAPEARWVVEYYPVEEVRPLPDGSLEVDLLVADPAWLRRLLLRLAPTPASSDPRTSKDFTTAVRHAPA